MKMETINENYNVTLTISNEVGDKLHEAKTNTNTIQDIGAMTGDNALIELYNNGLRDIKKSNL
jgi:tRNA U34 5-methylaminomethyl-2-thiouridine-forming methyltransferase MnmC